MLCKSPEIEKQILILVFSEIAGTQPPGTLCTWYRRSERETLCDGCHCTVTVGLNSLKQLYNRHLLIPEVLPFYSAVI